MSGTTESLGRRIAGAGDLEAVVRSMKALAAASVGQYEKAVLSLELYYRAVELGLVACLRLGATAGLMPATRRAKDTAIGAIVFGSDQGLVGRFNEVLVDFVVHSLASLPAGPRKVWAVGERIHALLAERGLPEAGIFTMPTSVNGITPLVGQILAEIEAAREKGEITEVHLFHNHPGPGANYEPARKRLLPLDHVWQSRLAAEPWPTKALPEVIGGAVTTLQAFLQGYFFVLLFQACAESLASESASCLASMQRAEKNIGEMLEDLNRTFHRLRQESIDEELFDVISGYEALSKTAQA